MLMKQMTIHVVTGAKEVDFSLTFTKFDYLMRCLKVSQVAPRSLNVALHVFACMFMGVFFSLHLAGKSY